MTVVSARMHFPFDGAGVGKTGFLMNGEGVDVCPKQNGLVPFSRQVSQGSGATTQITHMLNAQLGEVFADDFGGPVLVVGQLWMPVDVVANLNEIGNDGIDAFCVRGHTTRIGDKSLNAGGANPCFVYLR